MRLTVVHNPSAGDEAHAGDRPTAADLRRHLSDLGHDVRYVSSKGDWQPTLDEPADLLVAAGGDGTVAKVIRHGVGHSAPLAILPLGTANNVARSLGIEGDWRDLAAGWRRSNSRPFDVGRIGGAGGRFVEAVGGGFMAELIRRGEKEVEGRVPHGGERNRALDLLVDVISSAEPARWTVTLDGSDHQGEYLAVEAMNIGFAGPNVPLSATADPGDGLLDVVLVGENDRSLLLAYLRQRLDGGSADKPRLPVRRARSVRLRVDSGRPVGHVDDEVADGLAIGAPVELDLANGAVSILLPAVD